MIPWLQDRKNKHLAQVFAIGISGFILQIVLILTFRQYTKDGIHFQEWSSETMMQTVALEDLYTAPLETLWNIHIQPPGFDSIRAFLVRLWPSDNPLVAIAHVDILLYGVWSLLFGFMGALIFTWVYELTELTTALIAAFVFYLHPASIFYTTFLESTLLSAFLILLMYYFLWKLTPKSKLHIRLCSLLVILLFFTRTVFQWPFFIIFFVCLYMVGLRGRYVIPLIIATLTFPGFYLLKQHNQFGILSTSSLSGYNLSRSVSIGVAGFDFVEYLHEQPDEDDKEMPRVLTRPWKATGAINFNHIRYLPLYEEFTEKYIEFMQNTSPKTLLNIYRDNLEIYFQPSSIYSPHVIVDRLSWRPVFDRIFSYPVLVILIALAGFNAVTNAILNRQITRCIGLALPAAYIFAVCVLAERGENMRFKYLIEPVMIVFIIYQFYEIWQRLLAGRIGPSKVKATLP